LRGIKENGSEEDDRGRRVRASEEKGCVLAVMYVF
jgi:hypothetical protein